MKSSIKFIPISEAARIMNCTTERIHAFADEGLLHRKLEGDQAFVDQAEVLEIHRLNLAGELKPGDLVRRLLELESKVRRMEAQINLIFEVNGMLSSRFKEISDADLAVFYESAILLSGTTDFDYDLFYQVADYLIKITEVEISRVGELLCVDNAWHPFYYCCINMIKILVQQEGYDQNLKLQKLHSKLLVGRKNLSEIGIFFINHSAAYGPSQKLLASMAVDQIESVTVIAQRNAQAANVKGRNRGMTRIG